MTATEAELYRALHRGTPGDLSFYRERCAGASRVLELGCGYGRILETLFEPGRDLVGLDLDPALLDLARNTMEARPDLELICGDMSQLKLPNSFDRIILAFNTFYCIPESKKHDLLRRIHDHLLPGGKLLLDAYRVPSHTETGSASFCPPEAIVTLDLGDGPIEVFEESYEDYGSRSIQVTYTFYQAGSQLSSQTIHHAYWFDDTFPPALRAAGFEIEFFADGFGRDPSQVVVIARRR